MVTKKMPLATTGLKGPVADAGNGTERADERGPRKRAAAVAVARRGGRDGAEGQAEDGQG